MSEKQVLARIEALEAAAGHLELEWTDNATEREQGRIVAAELRKQIDAIIDNCYKLPSRSDPPEVKALVEALRTIRDICCGEPQCKQSARIALAAYEAGKKLEKKDARKGKS